MYAEVLYILHFSLLIHFLHAENFLFIYYLQF